MRIVAALGGNALLRRGEPADLETQWAHVEAAAASLAPVAEEHELVLTHGNGPQVGLLALQAEAYPDVRPYPLDVLGAETQGMIGYLLAQALGERVPARAVAVLVTRVVVAADDPAFREPTKPIGIAYSEDEAKRLATERGWTVARDGERFRRVVPSPAPLEIVEVDVARGLVAAGALVICCGGGGVPVIRDEPGLRGVEAVIDKDRTAALLAESVEADLMLLLTDVPRVVRDWGTARATPIEEASPQELRTMAFASGSMGPKIEAACRFVERSGHRAAIGSLDDALAVVEGAAGTQVRGRSSPARRGRRAQRLRR